MEGQSSNTVKTYKAFLSYSHRDGSDANIETILISAFDDGNVNLNLSLEVWQSVNSPCWDIYVLTPETKAIDFIVKHNNRRSNLHFFGKCSGF